MQKNKHWGHLILKQVRVEDTKGETGVLKMCECGELNVELDSKKGEPDTKES